MKRAKLRQLVEEVVEMRDVLYREPVVTFRSLVINFDDHTFTLDGRTIRVEAPSVSFPILSTDHVIHVDLQR